MKVDKRKKILNPSELVNTPTINDSEAAISGSDTTLDAHQTLPVNPNKLGTQKSEFNHLREELQEYRNKYSVLFDLSPISYLTIDDKGIILEVNLSLANLLGVQKQNLIGVELIKFVDTTSRKTFQAQLNTSFTTGVRQSCQINMRNSSGSTLTTNLESIPIRDSKGYLSQCRLIISDMVETNNSSKATQTYNPNSDAVITSDCSLNITSWNKSAEEMFGWKTEEAIGIPDSSRICTKILEVLTQEQVMQNLREHDSWSGESTCYKKDGSKFQAFTSIGVIWNKEGSFNGIVAVFHPIVSSKDVIKNDLDNENENEIEGIVKERTEELAKANRVLQQELRIHKQAALLAKESEGKNRDLVDNIRLGIFRRTPGIKGKFLEVNKAMEGITGFPRQELLEMNISDLYVSLTELDTFTNEASISDWKETRELKLKKKDGNVITIVETVVAIRYDSGKILFWDGIVEDITERKQAQQQIQDSLQRLQKTIKEIIQAMAYIGEVRDPYTAGHQKRVAQISFELARIMGIPDDQYEGLTMAAFVHDIGKILVPSDILSKPGKLTKPEFDMLKDHTRIGYEILKTIEFPWPIAKIVLQHHERMNGSGYPAGLSGNQIILEARILAVADVVEAMSSHRPYRPALGIDKALAEINQNKGTLYDPTVVDACDKLFLENGFHLN